MSIYKNIFIVYYSGTGNSKRVSEWIAGIAKEKGLNVFLFSYQEFINAPRPELTGKTLIGLCSATHGFNLPHSFIKLIFRFKLYPNSDVFIINTRAGMKLGKIFLPGLSGITQFLPALVLFFKGYKVVAMQPVDLPSNWISIHPGLKEKVVNSMYLKWKEKIKVFTENILNGKGTYIDSFIYLPLDILVAPIALGYYFVGRFVLAKTFIATDKCNKCGICIESCPTKSIKYIDDRPYWKLTCESCMHCMNYCPQRAIETPHSIVIPLIWLISVVINPFVAKHALIIIKNHFLFSQKLSENIISVVGMLVTIFSFVLTYYVLHFLLRYKYFNKLITYTSLTKFNFWRRYKIPN
ncbi:MAG: EFR1 family ferrodoxin [Bacteroidales bacterium]|nr:EFR1 family ferrodoxin [Bacteroidales bacterium]